MLIIFKSAPILKRALKVKHAMMQVYVLTYIVKLDTGSQTTGLLVMVSLYKCVPLQQRVYNGELVYRCTFVTASLYIRVPCFSFHASVFIPIS